MTPKIWQCFENLIANGKVIIPKDVELELVKDSEVKELVKKHPKIVQDTVEMADELTKVMRDFPYIPPRNRTKETYADPVVIALALSIIKQGSLVERKVFVVSQETSRKSYSIPSMCKHYDIPLISIQDLIRQNCEESTKSKSSTEVQ